MKRRTYKTSQARRHGRYPQKLEVELGRLERGDAEAVHVPQGGVDADIPTVLAVLQGGQGHGRNEKG